MGIRVVQVTKAGTVWLERRDADSNVLIDTTPAPHAAQPPDVRFATETIQPLYELLTMWKDIRQHAIDAGAPAGVVADIAAEMTALRTALIDAVQEWRGL